MKYTNIFIWIYGGGGRKNNVLGIIPYDVIVKYIRFLSTITVMSMRGRAVVAILIGILIGSVLGTGFVGATYGDVVTRSATNEALAILEGDFKDYLVGATFNGVDEQVLIATKPVLGFSIDGNSYLILSSGDARYVIGTREYDVEDMGGVHIESDPVTGREAYDVATLKITLKVPEGATTLSFKWRFLTDEFPEDNYFQDYFYSYVVFPDGNKVTMATLPNGMIPHVGPIAEYVRETTSGDGVYLEYVTTSTFVARVDVSGYQGKTITLVLQVADVGDEWVDTAVLIDDLKFTVSPTSPRGQNYVQLLTVARLWTLRFFTFHDRFDELYANATVIGVDNETLSKAMALHQNATATMQEAWGNYELETVRRLMWSTMFMPRIGLVIKAYRDEMAAIQLLEDAIAEMQP